MRKTAPDDPNEFLLGADEMDEDNELDDIISGGDTDDA